MKKIVKTTLFVLWMLLIFGFSNQNGVQSSGLSSRLLTYIANFLQVKDIDSFINTYSFLIRKTAHFSEYFILFILAYECFKEYGIGNLLLISIIFCVGFACLDEFHQLFISGRSGQIKDVLIDSSGSLFSSLFWHKLVKR